MTRTHAAAPADSSLRHHAFLRAVAALLAASFAVPLLLTMTATPAFATGYAWVNPPSSTSGASQTMTWTDDTPGTNPTMEFKCSGWTGTGSDNSTTINNGVRSWTFSCDTWAPTGPFDWVKIYEGGVLVLEWPGSPPEPCAWSSPTACDGPMGAGETVETMPGADAESLARCTGGSTKPHCLGWASTHWYTWDHDGEERPHPDLNGPVPKRWTFYVEDYGWNLTPLGAETYAVGWTCARQGPLYGEASRHEGWASWRGGQTRKFNVGVCDAPGTYLWNFYVLREQVPGIADYDKVEVFWGYGRPGATIPTQQAIGPATSCVGGCSTNVLPGPAPTSTPAPTTVAPNDDTEEPVVGPVAGSGCDFGITDPSSWLCGLTGLVKRLLDVAGAILGWLRSLGSFLMGLFVPDLQTLQDSFADVDTAWDASGPGQLTGGVTDIAAPVLSMDENMPTSCEGPQFTLPLPDSRSFSMNPLSTCGELTQYILGVVYPLETALIYLGGFFLGLRIVTRPFGMETPGTSQAAAA